MSVRCTAWAMSAPVDSPVERLVLLWLADGADDDGNFAPNLSRAADFCCADLTVLWEAFGRLSARRLIYDDARGFRFAIEPTPLIPSASRWTCPPKLRAELLEAAGNKCAACGSPDRLAIDHIIPRSKGGLNERDNLQVLCGPCNSSKSDKLPHEWQGRAA